MFKSQYGQDEFIYNTWFKDKKDGFFLEIGADDGIRFSNCYFFEKQLGWKGIAIEPRKNAFDKLIINRNCKCHNAALSDKKEKAKFMDIKGWGLGLSGLVNKYDPQHKKRIEWELKNPQNCGHDIIEVDTIKLSDLLDEEGVTHIDFLSIDTEGSELDILTTLDFNKVQINIITVEDNYNDPKLMEFFVTKGYKFVKQIMCDKVFKKV
jgi:FkbM family methyltransferase